jgi:DNA helicase-2/ATP-dependent DNA helicase PcrA
VVHAARERLERGDGLGDVTRGLADAIGLRQDINAAGPSPEIATRRWGNVEELIRTMARVPAGKLGEARQAVARLSLRFADEDDAPEDKVTLSTLHGAKGLEFEVVLLIGLDEGILPHSRTTAPKATDIASTIDASEERRLFYVGVTRAKQRLYLIRAKTRALRGAPRPTTPSRFLDDIPPGAIERQSFTAQAPLAAADLAAQARAALDALRSFKR